MNVKAILIMAAVALAVMFIVHRVEFLDRLITD